MIIGIGVFVLGVATMAAFASLLGMALDFNFELGFLLSLLIAAIVGIYFIGKWIAIDFGLI